MDLAQQVKEFTEELFELSKHFWIAQSRSKGKEETEITETEFLALDLLFKSESLGVGDIQRHIGVLPAQMSRIIRSLENKGDQPLITCSINPNDKRKIDVKLTQAGRETHQAYRRMKLGSIEKMLFGLSQHDRQEFMRILRTVREAMHKSLLEK